MERGLLWGVQRHLLRLSPDAVAGRLGAVSHPRLGVPRGRGIWGERETRKQSETKELCVWNN